MQPPVTSPASPSTNRPFWKPRFAAAGVAILAAVLGAQNIKLLRQVDDSKRAAKSSERELEKVKAVMTLMTSPESTKLSLTSAAAKARPHGRVFYSKPKGHLVFLAENLAPSPRKKVYELWLMPAEGAPIPAGVFKPDERGAASLILPKIPANIEAKTFAVTIEDEAGSAAPTLPPVMLTPAAS